MEKIVQNSVKIVDFFLILWLSQLLKHLRVFNYFYEISNRFWDDLKYFHYVLNYAEWKNQIIESKFGKFED